MRQARAMILRLLAAIVALSALPHSAWACRISIYAAFVFERLPAGIPDDALVLQVKFSPPLVLDSLPRRRQLAEARVGRVVRGDDPGPVVQIALPGTVCSEYRETAGGLIAGRMEHNADGAAVFRPYWIWTGERSLTSKPELQGPD
jgi:hypothetical protein